MTCPEFTYNYIHTDPVTCTAALRTAMFTHLMNCEACRTMQINHIRGQEEAAGVPHGTPLLSPRTGRRN